MDGAALNEQLLERRRDGLKLFSALIAFFFFRWRDGSQTRPDNDSLSFTLLIHHINALSVAPPGARNLRLLRLRQEVHLHESAEAAHDHTLR